jgi:hypothetical protein
MAGYYHVTAGEWIRLPMKGYREQCCDCGLVHLTNFRIVQDKRGRNVIEAQSFRDGCATGGARRRATAIKVRK